MDTFQGWMRDYKKWAKDHAVSNVTWGSKTDITKVLRDLYHEWYECCGDIHVPIAEAIREIYKLRRENRELKEEIETLRDYKDFYDGSD